MAFVFPRGRLGWLGSRRVDPASSQGIFENFQKIHNTKLSFESLSVRDVILIDQTIHLPTHYSLPKESVSMAKALALNLENLSEVDEGRTAMMFNQAIEQIRKDILARGKTELGARKLTLELVFTPDGSGENEIDFYSKAKVTIPPMQTRSSRMAPRVNGIAFNPAINDSIDQEALPYGHDEEAD
jgi:hypothetical protein